jgi:hypothetical protein
MTQTKTPEQNAAPFDFQSSLLPDQCAALLLGMQANGLFDSPKCQVQAGDGAGDFSVRRYGKRFQTAEARGTLEGTTSGTRVRGVVFYKHRLILDDVLGQGTLLVVLVLLVGFVPALVNGLLLPLLCLLPLCFVATWGFSFRVAAHNRDRLLSDLRQKLRGTS